MAWHAAADVSCTDDDLESIAHQVLTRADLLGRVRPSIRGIVAGINPPVYFDVPVGTHGWNDYPMPGVHVAPTKSADLLWETIFHELLHEALSEWGVPREWQDYLIPSLRTKVLLPWGPIRSLYRRYGRFLPQMFINLYRGRAPDRDIIKRAMRICRVYGWIDGIVDYCEPMFDADEFTCDVPQDELNALIRDVRRLNRPLPGPLGIKALPYNVVKGREFQSLRDRRGVVVLVDPDWALITEPGRMAAE